MTHVAGLEVSQLLAKYETESIIKGGIEQISHHKLNKAESYQKSWQIWAILLRKIVGICFQ